MKRHSLCLLALAAGAVALFADSTAAQYCPPWSKFRMHQIAWSAGSTLELGDVEHGQAAIALRFRHDPDCGVLLESIGHRGTRKDGTVTRLDYSTAPPPSCPQALWKAVFRPLSSDDPIEVFPDSARWVRVWVDCQSEPRSAIFRWDGLSLPNQTRCDSIFWMELRVAITPGRPDRSEWHSRMGRIQLFGGEKYTLDEVHAPILYTRQPGDGLLSRMLVPVASNAVVPDTNLPMRLWQVIGYDLELEHPARGQQLQCSAIYSGDPTDVPNGDHVISSYRKLLYFATEDTDGYYKKFAHKVVQDSGVLFYRWAPIYFPTYGPFSFLNFHWARYPVVISALEARTDSFWYDVTERYREFVDHEMRPTPIDSPHYPINRDFTGSSNFIATSVIAGVSTDLPPIYDTFVDQAMIFQRAFTGADGQPTPMFMEWQKWLKGDPIEGPTGPPIDPIGPGFNPRPFSGAAEALLEPPLFVRDEIDRAYAAGINLSVYTLPIVMNDEDWPSFEDLWFLRQRDGSYYPIGPAYGKFVDFGYRDVPQWHADNLYDDVMRTTPSLGGVFFDVLSGGGAFLRYPPDPEKLFSLKRYHGGKAYVEGTQKTFDLVRARIARDKPTSVHPDVPFIASETVQEFLAGRYDFGQHGYKPVPFQMQNNRLFDQLSGVPSITPETSNPSPPLWNAVYHEYSRAEGLTVPLTVLAINGPFFGGGQFNPFFPGVTPARWGDYMRMVHALWWMQGMKLSYQYLFGLEPLNLLVERNGVVEARDPAIPQEVQLIEFLARLTQALDRHDEAGQFLLAGRVQRPLQTPLGYNPAAITQSTVPSFDIQVFSDPAAPGTKHFYESFFTTQPYPLPHVFHSVWQSPGPHPKLGIVFVNWTDFPAAWQGTLDPSCYEGFGESFTIKGLRPDGTGVTEYAVGQGQGPTTLAWNPTVPGITLQHHAAPAGLMPPRSIQVFLVVP